MLEQSKILTGIIVISEPNIDTQKIRIVRKGLKLRKVAY